MTDTKKTAVTLHPKIVAVRLVTDGEVKDFTPAEFVAEFAKRGFPLSGRLPSVQERCMQRAEIKNAPEFRGLTHSWGGATVGGAILRYESWAMYNLLST